MTLILCISFIGNPLLIVYNGIHTYTFQDQGAGVMAKLEIGRVRHAPSADEEKFYKELGKSLNFARTEAGITQTKMAKICGYSDQQIRNFERGSVPVPAYVMMKYADACRVTADELCAKWASEIESTYYQKLQDKEAEVHIRRLKPSEKILVSKLRSEHQKIGTMTAADLLFYMQKTDLELIYCIKVLESAEEWGYGRIAKSIRKQIYELYMLSGEDVKGRYNITKDLDDTLENVQEIPQEEELSFDFD